jgi:hypothetical protein
VPTCSPTYCRLNFEPEDDGSYSGMADGHDTAAEIDLIASIEHKLSLGLLTGFVIQGLVPYGRNCSDRLDSSLFRRRFCRESGIRVIYTAHVHRRDGSDMGLYDDLCSPIADRSTLVDGTSGVEIFHDLPPAPGEHVIKKHRYSAFLATDLDLILREWGITTVIISGTTTENCCHATARDAMFNNYKVVFLSDATGTFDYPDVGYGAMSAE